MKTRTWKIISIAIMLLIFFFSSQNGEKSSKSSGMIVQFVLAILPFLNKDLLHFLIRKAAHFTIFGCLGASFYQSLNKKSVPLALVLTFFYACSDEFHQSFVGERSAQFRDVLIDTCGALCFILVMYFLRKRKKESEDS